MTDRRLVNRILIQGTEDTGKDRGEMRHHAVAVNMLRIVHDGGLVHKCRRWRSSGAHGTSSHHHNLSDGKLRHKANFGGGALGGIDTAARVVSPLIIIAIRIGIVRINAQPWASASGGWFEFDFGQARSVVERRP